MNLDTFNYIKKIESVSDVEEFLEKYLGKCFNRNILIKLIL